MRGYVYSEIGNKRAAIRDYNQVIKIDPEYADAYVKRGYIHNEKGDKKSAIADFDKAISIFCKESMTEEVRTLQSIVQTLQEELKNTPWWQTRVF